MIVIVRDRTTGIPGISKFLELLDYWNLRDVLRPGVKKLVNMVCGHVMRDVNEMEQMTEPRIVKSHLPLYLLHPQLLDTSKVNDLIESTSMSVFSISRSEGEKERKNFPIAVVSQPSEVVNYKPPFSFPLLAFRWCMWHATRKTSLFRTFTITSWFTFISLPATWNLLLTISCPTKVCCAYYDVSGCLFLVCVTRSIVGRHILIILDSNNFFLWGFDSHSYLSLNKQYGI